jgi:hypothetical protein
MLPDIPGSVSRQSLHDGRAPKKRPPVLYRVPARFTNPFCLPFDKLRMYGSMVLYFFWQVIFRPAGEK